MGIIVDLIIIAVILLFILAGYKKGLTGSLIKLCSFFIAVVLAFVLYKPVADMIIEKTQIDDNIKATLTTTFKNEQNNEEESTMPSTMMESINKNIENATEEIKTEAIETTTVTIIKIASAIIIFIAVRIILAIVGLFVNQITKLPIINQIDSIGGIAYGAIEGLVIVYIVLSIVSLTSVIWTNNIIVTAITKSALGGMLYNNNLILKLLFK